MSFNTALSGINAAQSDLNVTSNNIANVNTTGFKYSRPEFADIYATSQFGSGKTAIGSGVLLSKVAQQFNQGNLKFTTNTLDIAISGEGFFIMEANSSNSDKLFTRSGEFGVDSEGYIVNSSNARLQGFPVNVDGTVSTTSLSSTISLQIPQEAGVPSATTEIDLGINLPADATGLVIGSFDPTSPSTYTSSTSSTFFDSLGESHVATAYFVKDSTTANQWAVYYQVDGANVNIPGGTAGAGGQLYQTMNFNSSGTLASTTPATVTTAALGFTNGSDATQTLTIDYANNNATQYAANFTVNTLEQDGYTIGRLNGIEITEAGNVRANFSNGQSTIVGKIGLVRFTNPQGMKQLGANSWQDTIDSGEPLAGEALSGNFGQIRAGALETSNVDLTKELVNLITAQRNFQANARTIETNSTVTQAVISIRG